MSAISREPRTARTRTRTLPRRIAPVAALATGLGSAVVALAPAAWADTVVSHYGYTGSEQTFTVPAGVTSVHVVAVGGRGGTSPGGYASTVAEAGGSGATTTADLDVSHIRALYVEVGGNGGDGSASASAAGGYNGGGGGATDGGSGGGGASDLRVVPVGTDGSLQSRVLVAGGGGGAGIGNAGGASNQNGAPGAGVGAGCPGGDSGGGGGGGTQSAGGAGGQTVGYGQSPRDDGQPGSLGAGGDGGINPTVSSPFGGGGGGGGGYYGGGGGGWGIVCGGAGGGGSSFADPLTGTTPVFDTDSTGTPMITISYVVPQQPQVTTTSADGIGQTSATLHGVVNPEDAATTYHFEYGTDTTYGTSAGDGSLPAGSSQQLVSAVVSGLTPGTKYYFRLVADNAVGSSSGDPQSFTTTAATPPPTATAPQATTQPATSVGTTRATLNGLVDPNGAATTVYFQYGYSTKYIKNTPSQSIGSGTADVNVRALLSGLKRHTWYHVRIVAVNTNGTAYGVDRAFRTS